MNSVVLVGAESDTVITVIPADNDPLSVQIKVYGIEHIDTMHVSVGDIDHLIKALKQYIDQAVA